MKKIFWFAVLAMVAITFAACGNDDTSKDNDGGSDTSSDTGTEGSADITGTLMKGPPDPNTTIKGYIANSVGEYATLVVNTQTTDFAGSFSTSIANPQRGPTLLRSDPAQFWDEISGLKLGGLQLQTMVDTKLSTTNLGFGVCGHLTARRIQNLMKGPPAISFAKAKVKAEKELVASLKSVGLIYTGTWTGCEAVHVIGSDTPDSQFGAALHCSVDKVANMEATESVEISPILQGFLDDFAADLADDGTIVAARLDRLRLAVQSLDPMSGCIQKLSDYLAEQTGTTPVVPDANASADMDGDGVPNAQDDDIDGDGIPNDQDEAPYDGSVGGGMYLDVVNGLAWELTVSDATYTWADAKTHCVGVSLGGKSDWRMPTIGELRTLIKGCAATETGGQCGVADSCTDQSCAGSACNGCTALGGPGNNGCYWDPRLKGPCDNSPWSSTVVTSATSDKVWVAMFNTAFIGHSSYTSDVLYPVICVRPLI